MAGLDREALHALMAAGIHVGIHLRRHCDGRRVVESINMMKRAASGLVESVPALVRGDECLEPARAAEDLADRIDQSGHRVP
jgi:pilus assembly protein CpaF